MGETYGPTKILPGLNIELRAWAGGGAHGDVYAAWDINLQTHRAVKLLKADLPDTEREKIAREWRILAKMRHPHIVEVYSGVFLKDARGTPCMVMEFLPGARNILQCLAAFEEPRRFTIARTIEVAIELLEALEHAHGKQLVHRDIKPENVLMYRAGENIVRAKLVDFGVVRDISRRERTIHNTPGTPEYLAPEVHAGDPATVQSDLYGLGIVLYYMVAGIHPLVCPTGNWPDAHRSVRPRPLVDVLPCAPAGLSDVLMVALAKDPADRPESASEMLDALRPLLWGPRAHVVGYATEVDPVDSMLRRNGGITERERTREVKAVDSKLLAASREEAPASHRNPRAMASLTRSGTSAVTLVSMSTIQGHAGPRLFVARAIAEDEESSLVDDSEEEAPATIPMPFPPVHVEDVPKVAAPRNRGAVDPLSMCETYYRDGDGDLRVTR